MGSTSTQYEKAKNMTLFKQIAMMLSVFLFIILTTVLILNFQSANKGVEDRLYDDAKNTATSLSLSLGGADGDITMMSTMINANFDSGNYKEIILIDVDDKVLFERKIEDEVIEVPSWFKNSVSIKAPVAYANVSAGWSQVGIISVQGNVNYAYKILYKIFINLLISFAIITFVAFVVLYTSLHAILKPLAGVQKQAEAVIRNKFIIQEDIPYTKEFKDVVLGMNNMVSKVQVMFEKGNEELRQYKEYEYTDKATNLKNRKYFIDKLPEFLKIDATSEGGVNMLIGLMGIIEANEHIGRAEVNDFFMAIANVFKNSVKSYENAIVSRMNGTEFSIFIPDCTDDEGLEIASRINDECSSVIIKMKLNLDETYICIGLYSYNYKEDIGKLLSHTDNALAKAKFGTTRVHIERSDEAVEVMGKEAWRSIINEAISKNNFNFVSYKTVDFKSKTISHNALSLTLEVDEKTTYYYGQFMALANQVLLSSDIYDSIIKKMFNNPNILSPSKTYSLRLPYNYLSLNGTYEKLVKIFRAYALKLPFNLIIEVPDKLVSEQTDSIKLYKKLFEEYGIEMGLFEFIGESNDYHYLQELRPVYIKAEASYFITQNNQGLSALRLITDTVGISLIAVGVMDKNTLDKLEEKDIHIIQGRASELIDAKEES